MCHLTAILCCWVVWWQLFLQLHRAQKVTELEYMTVLYCVNAFQSVHLLSNESFPLSSCSSIFYKCNFSLILCYAKTDMRSVWFFPTCNGHTMWCPILVEYRLISFPGEWRLYQVSVLFVQFCSCIELCIFLCCLVLFVSMLANRLAGKTTVTISFVSKGFHYNDQIEEFLL